MGFLNELIKVITNNPETIRKIVTNETVQNTAKTVVKEATKFVTNPTVQKTAKQVLLGNAPILIGGAMQLINYVIKTVRERFFSRQRARELAEEQKQQYIEQQKKQISKAIRNNYNSGNVNKFDAGIKKFAARDNNITYTGIADKNGKVISSYEIDYDQIEANLDRQLDKERIIIL